MLEGLFKVLYYYHLPFLNHFLNNDLLCLPFFLLHSLETSVKDTLDPKHEDKALVLLHQGLIYRI